MEERPIRQARVITDGAAGVISRVEELAYELRVEEVMTANVKTVAPNLHMVEVLELLREGRISGAPVVSNGKLVGVISIEDLIRCLRRGDLEAPVSSYMNTRLITVNSFDPVVEAMKTFSQTRVGRLPVLDKEGQAGRNHHQGRYDPGYLEPKGGNKGAICCTSLTSRRSGFTLMM